ncbi:FMN-binding negative transcriptional regulator [Moritella sp. Urea-trap-13]|uniref:FMN-binding negative transcriptional regulator n=1 Tax=Moritella sp. Urea-trap-13 TaxID=2058327 RepID=UPI000C34D027|nr:FMN-binding negative transcriptional regulator [Moritella sp. Urea-trap-13]PKH06892.1 transcriptional regulator [Moritella sp. Urea-trap-13]
MHIPGKFKQTDYDKLKDLIVNYPLATLISHSDSGLEANHIPFIFDTSQGLDVLQGHVAKANPVWKILNDNAEVLLVFHGSNGYISPNHYPTKQKTGRAVPTWNYVAVHVKGSMKCIHDDTWILKHITKLSDQHEAGQSNPWSVNDAPPEYIQRMLPAIVGLELKIVSITGQWKVSQNQPHENQLGVIAGLVAEGGFESLEMADLVSQHL